uniref:Uncharacterized protein n=1 Tax=Gossypium raimondii TaxID=29730 RepID=A0A0D2V4Y3_GOSRA|nr:hypothetical protein B456_010G031400 [Gossypium raimondii]KJB64065.1 hypothetical protein B456_010G031400 [Gossypium raimondii]
MSYDVVIRVIRKVWCMLVAHAMLRVPLMLWRLRQWPLLKSLGWPETSDFRCIIIVKLNCLVTINRLNSNCLDLSIYGRIIKEHCILHDWFAYIYFCYAYPSTNGVAHCLAH